MRQIVINRKVHLFWDSNRAIVQLRKVGGLPPLDEPSFKVGCEVNRDEALLLASELIRFVMNADIDPRFG